MDYVIQTMDRSYHFLVVASLTFLSIVARSMCQDHCFDHKGQRVPHGERYFPMITDPCTQCTCINGTPEFCISVMCSPPENCRQHYALNDKCCQYVCLDPPPFGGNVTENNKNDSLTVTNLGLRLVASAVTSFLILALLLFMIHRLRQRRLLLVIRRLNSNQGNGQQYSMDDEGSVGYFTGHDQLDFGGYDEPPPPYCFWKPPETYSPTGEAPPPYEATEGQNQNNNNSAPGLSQAPPGIESPKTEYNQMTQTEPIAALVEDPRSHVTVLQLRSSNRQPTQRLVEEDIRNGNILPSTSTPASSHRESMDGTHAKLSRDSRNSQELSSVTVSRPVRLQARNVSSYPNNIFSDQNTWMCEGSSSSSTSPSSSTTSEPQSTLSSSSSDTTSPDSDFVSQGTNEEPEVLNAIPENVVATVPKSKIGKTFWHLKQLSHHRVKAKARKGVTKNVINANPGVTRLIRPSNLNLNSWVVSGIRVQTNPTCNETIEENESVCSSGQRYNLNHERENLPSSVVVDNSRRSVESAQPSEPTYSISVSRTGSICSETGEPKQIQLLRCPQHRQEGTFCNCTYVQQSCGNNLISGRYGVDGKLTD